MFVFEGVKYSTFLPSGDHLVSSVTARLKLRLWSINKHVYNLVKKKEKVYCVQRVYCVPEPPTLNLKAENQNPVGTSQGLCPVTNMMIFMIFTSC